MLWGHKSSPRAQEQGSPPEVTGLPLGGFAQLLSAWTLSSLHQELPFSFCGKPQPNWRIGPLCTFSTSVFITLSAFSGQFWFLVLDCQHLFGFCLAYGS